MSGTDAEASSPRKGLSGCMIAVIVLADRPARRSTTWAFGAPMFATGAFWFVRNWVRGALLFARNYPISTDVLTAAAKASSRGHTTKWRC